VALVGLDVLRTVRPTLQKGRAFRLLCIRVGRAVRSTSRPTNAKQMNKVMPISPAINRERRFDNLNSRYILYLIYYFIIVQDRAAEMSISAKRSQMQFSTCKFLISLHLRND
jgi:hypothetical protein